MGVQRAYERLAGVWPPPLSKPPTERTLVHSGVRSRTHITPQRRAGFGLSDHNTPQTALKQTTNDFHPNPRKKG